MNWEATAGTLVIPGWGSLRLAVASGRVCGIEFGSTEAEFRRSLERRGFSVVSTKSKDLSVLENEIEQYLSGQSNSFTVKADLRGVTPFTFKVLSETARLSFGQTATYGEMAARVGSPRAARAVGSALRRNPVPIVVPCHRVLAAGNRIGGFSSGVERKRRLLALEE